MNVKQSEKSRGDTCLLNRQEKSLKTFKMWTNSVFLSLYIHSVICHVEQYSSVYLKGNICLKITVKS